MAIIEQSQIIEQEQIIRSAAAHLSDSVASFTSVAKEVDEVVAALRICLNTTGGARRIASIASVEFDTAGLNNISSSAASITSRHQKVRRNL